MTDILDYHGWPLRQQVLVFRTAEGEDIQLRPTTLLVALDETGGPDLLDPAYPIFGIGGCAILAGQYIDTIHLPWIHLKEAHFGRRDVPLHASAIDLQANALVEALSEFFATRPFFRIGAVLSKRSVLMEGTNRLGLAFTALLACLTEVGKRVPFTDLVFLFESAYTGGELVWQGFEDIKPTRFVDGALVPVPVRFVHSDKSHQTPALEVADFIVNAAGGGARARLRDQPMTQRRDFAAVFGSPPEGWSHFIHLDTFGLVDREA